MTLLEKYNELSSKEQTTIKFGSIAVFALLSYQFMFTPMVERISKIQQDLAYQLSLNQWMNQLPKPSSTPISAQRKQISQTQLLPTLSTALKRSGLNQYKYQLQQTSGRSAQLVFAEVPYVDFISWLSVLTQSVQVDITRLTATKLPKAGLVKVSTNFQITT